MKVLLTKQRSIDILASRIAGSTNSHPSNSHGQAGSNKHNQSSRTDKNIRLYSLNRTKTRGVGSCLASSSQERIINRAGEDNIGTKSMAGTTDHDRSEASDEEKNGTIRKTVEFGFVGSDE
jgi:hypothetical protein